jgi:4'-phosphopantetheinyl transferase
MNLSINQFDSLATPICLPDYEEHLWIAQLDNSKLLDDCKIFLTSAEWERASKFRMKRVQDQFILSRGILRSLLGRYLGIAPIEVPIEALDGGKPVLSAPYQHLHFNISHSNHVGVFGFVRHRRIGVDVEHCEWKPIYDGLVDRFFSHRERDLFKSIPPEERKECFFRAWTRKEAILKAVGLGVQSLDSCDVTFRREEPPTILRLNDDFCADEKWILYCWEPEPNFMAAVAFEKRFPG